MKNFHALAGNIMRNKHAFGKPVPVFRVSNVEASIAYYRDVLGFELSFQYGASFASVVRDDCNIFITDDNQSPPRVWVWIGVRDVRSLHALYLQAGAKVRNPPNNFEWGLEMQVEDLDGNVLRIGSDREAGQPLGVWKDADGVRWRHLGDQQYERLD